MRILLSLLLILCQEVQVGYNKGATGPAPSGFAYIASSVTGCSNLQAAQTKCIYNLHQNPGSGHLLLLMANCGISSGTITVSSTNNTWTAIGSPKTGINGQAGNIGQMFYVASAVSSGTETVTMTCSASSGVAIWEAAEYSYSGTISGFDGVPVYSNTTAVAGVGTTGSLTTSNSSDLLWASCLGVDTTCTVGAGFTSHNDTAACISGSNPTTSCQGGTTGDNFQNRTGSLIEEKTGVGAGSQSATFGMGTTDANILGLVAF